MSNGKAISGASIGAQFGCCTESDGNGVFTIGLREGRTRIYILPSGNEKISSAGTFFTVTMIGNMATNVTNEAGANVPIINGLHQFEFVAPDISGEITTTSIYAGLSRYSRLSSPQGATDIMMNRGKMQNSFAYKVPSLTEYFPYFEFRGSRQLFAIGSSCPFTGTPVTCPIFEIKEPNLTLRLVGSSGIPASKTSVSVRPVSQGTAVDGLQAWQNEDLTFSYFLADGVYLIEPFLNDLNNTRRLWEVRVLNGQQLSVVDLFSGDEVQASGGVYDLDYLTSRPKMNFAISLFEQIPGGAVFKIEPDTKIRLWVSATVGSGNSSYSMVLNEPPSKEGLVAIKDLKRQDQIQIILKNSFGQRVAASTWNVIERLSEAEVKADADAKARAEVEAKARADAKVMAEADATARAIANARAIEAAKKKTTITCIKGKLSKKVTAIKPKCPGGYLKK